MLIAQNGWLRVDVVVVVVVVEQPVTLNSMGVLLHRPIIQTSFCSCRLPGRTFVHEVDADVKKSQV